MAYDDAIVRGRESAGLDEVPFGSRRAVRPRAGDDRQSEYRGTRYRDEVEPPQPLTDTGGWAQRGSHRQGPADRHAQYRRPQEEAEVEVQYATGSTAALDDVFDDPEHGEPGRDRMGVHVAWEVVLLGAAGALVYLLHREDPSVFRVPTLDTLLISATVLGLLVLAAGLSLRAGVPNLAVGPVAVAVALHYAENSDQGMPYAAANPAMVAAFGGALLAVVVVGLHVPAWAASLGGALAVVVFIQLRTAPVAVQGGFDPQPRALYLFGGFAALAVVGGLIGSRRAVRRMVGRFRAVSDPADRRGGVAGAVAAAALIGSVLLATGAGVLLAAGSDTPITPTTGLEWTGLAIGTAMLAGTSAFGRRGGVFGTLFAVVLVTLFRQYEQQQDLRISLFAIAAGLLGAGLLVTRLVEAYGRPMGGYRGGRPVEVDPVAQPVADPAIGTGYEPWTPASTMQQPAAGTERWGPDNWSGPAR